MENLIKLQTSKSETAKSVTDTLADLPYQQELLPKTTEHGAERKQRKTTAAAAAAAGALRHRDTHKSHVSSDDKMDDEILKRLRQRRMVREEIQRRNRLVLAQTDTTQIEILAQGGDDTFALRARR